MDATEFETRKEELLDECDVAAQVFARVMPRLERFMEPFVDSLIRREQIEHANTFVQGLLSDLKHKNAESIAYRFGQERMPLQWFLGVSPWDDKPLRDELVRQVGKQLGEADGVIVFDPSAFPKSGTQSVGVARQWSGRQGKVDNCQVGIFMGYVSSREHALVDMRLYLPKEWTQDQQRRKKAGIPKDVRYRTRHQLCLEMLAKHAELLLHTWICGDDEMGRPYWFRRRLDQLDERYLLAVPCNTLVRDLPAVAALAEAGYTFKDVFLGFIPGSIGETSTLACLMGLIFLLVTRVASWRIVAGCALGLTAMSSVFFLLKGESSMASFSLPPYWHMALGGFAFGSIFMATDPVSSSATEQGRWIYGFLIGVLVILIRVVNPAYPEGVMLAILFMNIFAPFIDHFVVQQNIKRRLARAPGK